MDKKKVQEAWQVLKTAQSELAGSGSSAALLGERMQLLETALETHALNPPGMKTMEFKNQGDAVPLEDLGAGDFLERIIDESELVPISFLEQGVNVQRSVGRVVLTKAHVGFPPGTGWATGFLVSPSLFLTNNHVIPNKAFAGKIRVQFNFQLSPEGIERPTDSFLPAPSDFFLTNAALDYTLIRLRSKPVADDPNLGSAVIEPGQRWGFIEFNDAPVFRVDQHFNIVQHPNGRLKEVALQDNEIDKLFTNVVQYKSDTEPGSSGSPVFDNLWQLVALHHAGGEQSPGGTFINNEGIRIDSVANDLRAQLGNTDEGKKILEELGI